MHGDFYTRRGQNFILLWGNENNTEVNMLYKTLTTMLNESESQKTEWKERDWS